MPKIIEVVYENGVFKPLEKVELKDKTRCRVIIDMTFDELFGMFRGKRVSVNNERDLMIGERA